MRRNSLNICACGRPRSSSGFSLLELLVVIGLICILIAGAGPAIQALSGAGSTTKAAADISSLLTLARSFAIAHNTYVRVGIAEVKTPGEEKVIVMPIFSADGSLEKDTSTDMGSPLLWPSIGRPLVVRGIEMADGSVEGALPDTSEDDSIISAEGDIPSFRRVVSGVNLEFTRSLQFNPTGDVRIIRSIPSRYVKIPLDRADGQAGRNPFLLRVSSGSVRILRVGEGIQ